jgi:hypothetical protein
VMGALVDGAMKQGKPVAAAVRSLFAPPSGASSAGEETPAAAPEAKARVRFATVVYGLPHVCVVGSE